MSATIRLGSFELRCGADPTTGDFILRTHWHRYRHQGALVPAGDGNAVTEGRTDPALLAQVHQANQKAPLTVSEIANAVANLSPDNLRKLRLAVTWEGHFTGWQASLITLSVFAALSVGMPAFFSVMVFIFDTPNGWEKVAAMWGAGFRGLLVFLPLLLAVRAAAARWLTLPITQEYVMRRAWAKAFGTQD